MKYILRFTIYFAGLFLLAIGINLAIKSNLGASPVSALPLAISEVMGLSLGMVTSGVYIIYVLAQACILRREFKLKNLLQIFFCFPFGYFVDFAAVLLQGLQANSYLAELLLMSISIIIVSIGVVMFIEMDIVPNAPDGLLLAIRDKVGIDFGQLKMVFDCSSVAAAALISLLFIGHISIIREGTIIAALFTGKLISIISKPWAPRLKRVVFNTPNELAEDWAA